MVCVSRKTFARAIAWAQAEAKRGMDPGERLSKGKKKKIVLVRVERTHTIIASKGMK